MNRYKVRQQVNRLDRFEWALTILVGLELTAFLLKYGYEIQHLYRAKWLLTALDFCVLINSGLIKDHVAHAVYADVTDEDVMAALELDKADTVVVAIGEDQHASIFCTAILKQLGARNIIARAMTRLHDQILKQVGATRVISVEEQMGEQLAKTLVTPYILERLELPDGLVMAEIEAPKDFVGKSLNELQVRTRYGLHILALKKRVPTVDPQGENTSIEKVSRFPYPNVKIESGHIMTVVGDAEAIDHLPTQGG